MKNKLVLIAFLSLAANGCATNGVSRSPSADMSVGSECDDMGDISIWSLKCMAQSKQVDKLEELFNNGERMDRLPEGYAAGAGARVFNSKTPLGQALLDGITGKDWRGKMFFPSLDGKVSMGLNRIRGNFPGSHVVPMASFVTELVEPDQIIDYEKMIPGIVAKNATRTADKKANLVILNYSKPVTTGEFWQELALDGDGLLHIQVYDVMAGVRKKNGHLIYIGKTWLGEYNDKHEFHTDRPDRLIAWFFLDFDPEVVAYQKANHWDRSEEDKLDPLPNYSPGKLPIGYRPVAR